MYNSTRNVEKKKITASNAIINGLASDGGLFVLDQIPKIDYSSLINKNYHELAYEVMKLFLDDFSDFELKEIIKSAYDNKFDEGIVKLKSFEKYSFLELYHGRTLAFKDMALSVLPLLLKKAKEKNNISKKTTILTATSGDTGSAALSGFSDICDIDIVVIYPKGKVSLIQERQMLSFRKKNALVFALDGNFDDAQNLVKSIFNEHNQSFSLSSANSINIGRLIPQIVYYFYGYLELVRTKKICLGDKVNFVVPTGNFGNILAGFLAQKMSLPINKLICASNTNNVLTDFFNKGIYNKNREFLTTISPSMDILISSNLERLLYYISDPIEVKNLMDNLSKYGFYQLPVELKDKLSGFYASFATEEETLLSIKEQYESNNYLIDTHTAVAYSVYKKYKVETNDSVQSIILSTAHPYKFPKAVARALNLEDNDEFNLIKSLNEKTGVLIPEVINRIMKESYASPSKKELEEWLKEVKG